MNVAGPLISVVIPVYNTQKYLERCVESVLCQSYGNLEVILVDDGSPDNCGKMCDAFAQQDARIRVIHQDNEGQASARNRGLDIAKGEYIGFVDSDDYIDTGMYNSLYTLLVKNDVQIACCGTCVVDEQGKTKSTFNNPTEGIILYDRDQALGEHLHNTRITSSLCDKLYVAEIFNGIRMIEGMIYEDMEVLPRCLAKAQQVVYSSEPLYYNVMTANSTMRGRFSLRQFDMMKAGKLRFIFYQKSCHEHINLAKEMLIEICLSLIYKSYGNKECDALRNEAIREAIVCYKSIEARQQRMKTRFKMCLLHIGIPVFSYTMKLYYSISKSINEFMFRMSRS
jgi:glycosyltransferase involved in cell wall biosynthesis